MNLRAVGVRPDGTLFGIRGADTARGQRFLGILVAVDQEKWWLENKPTLEACTHGVEGAHIDLLFDIGEEEP